MFSITLHMRCTTSPEAIYGSVIKFSRGLVATVGRPRSNPGPGWRQPQKTMIRGHCTRERRLATDWGFVTSDVRFAISLLSSNNDFCYTKKKWSQRNSVVVRKIYSTITECLIFKEKWVTNCIYSIFDRLAWMNVVKHTQASYNCIIKSRAHILVQSATKVVEHFNLVSK